MERLTLSHVLVKDAKIEVKAISKSNEEVSKYIDETRKKQEEILKLKEINQESLKMVVQL